MVDRVGARELLHIILLCNVLFGVCPGPTSSAPTLLLSECPEVEWLEATNERSSHRWPQGLESSPREHPCLAWLTRRASSLLSKPQIKG